MKDEDARKAVRNAYARIAKDDQSCCGDQSCCVHDVSGKIGYTEQEIKMVPEGSNLGLGCGNPVALASLKKGEVVLDLGSGAGFDCFLAAKQVGERGKVIGVDMTPEMVERARENARKGKYRNVEFRLGEIENLPVANNLVDVVISNCVINLAPDKKRVFKEAYRVLNAGGRLMVSDIVLLKELPDFIKESVEAYVGCLSGAMLKDKYMETIRKAGFRKVRITGQKPFPLDCMINDPTAKAIIDDLKITPEDIREYIGSVLSINISATKPNMS